MVGVDRSQVDSSPPGSVIAILLLHLMVSGVPRHWLGVRNLAPLDSISMQLADCQEGQFVSLR